MVASVKKNNTGTTKSLKHPQLKLSQAMVKAIKNTNHQQDITTTTTYAISK